MYSFTSRLTQPRLAHKTFTPNDNPNIANRSHTSTNVLALTLCLSHISYLMTCIPNPVHAGYTNSEVDNWPSSQPRSFAFGPRAGFEHLAAYRLLSSAMGISGSGGLTSSRRTNVPPTADARVLPTAAARCSSDRWQYPRVEEIHLCPICFWSMSIRNGVAAWDN